MTEPELRRLAEAARALLDLLVPGQAEADRIRARLSAALARPPGQAELALLSALSDHPVLRDWMTEQLRRRFRAPLRYLTAQVPERVPVGYEFSVLVRITRDRHRLSAALAGLSLRPDGTTITVTAWAPGLRALGHLRQELRVPPDGDTPPAEFGFRSVRPGQQEVIVHAFADGTFLGEISARISVRAGAAVETGALRATGLPGTDPEPGEVTLEVSRTWDDRYSVRLVGGGTTEPELSERLAGDPRHAIEDLADELRRFALGKSAFGTAAARRDRLRNLGVNLWAQAVPPAVRQQFWELGDGIRSFRVLSDAGALPWELLYPLDGEHDRGFLVDQFPVVRHVGCQGRARSLPVRSVAFVVPERRPANADEEVRRVRQLLGRLPDRGQVTQLGQLSAMLETPPGVLHFACHHEFTDEAGPLLTLGGGPFRPTDLAVAVQRRSLCGAAPVVFFNACRSADEIPGLTRPMGWARQFMAAGAGAFLGTLWPVRSASALAFAESFYGSFIAEGRTLGAAVSRARAEVAGDDGDPTWLAYTLYGDPSATGRLSARDGES